MSKKPSTSLTSLAASEDSALDLNEPDLFGQLPSVSENPSRKQSSESTGPKSPSTTMSEPSQQSDLEELISSAEGSPVSLGVSPGSSEAQKMTVTSGRSWLPLLKSYGLDGSLGKMCEALLTRNWASSAAFLTWKASGMKSPHLLFQLAPSMPRTEGIASGLWLTPTASESVTDLEKFKERMEKYNNGTTMPNLATQVSQRLWQTPRASDGKGSASPESAMGAIRRMGGPTNLPEQTQLVEHRLWPTPTTRDYKGANSDEHLAKARGHHDQLPNAVKMAGDKAGSLNPQWVEWLMGFPEGWTDLNPSEMPSSRKSSNKSGGQ